MRLSNLYTYRDSVSLSSDEIISDNHHVLNNSTITLHGFTPHRDSDETSRYRVIGNKLVISSDKGYAWLRLPILPLHGLINTVESIRIESTDPVRLASEMYYIVGTGVTPSTYTTLYTIVQSSGNMLLPDTMWRSSQRIGTNDYRGVDTERGTILSAIIDLNERTTGNPPVDESDQVKLGRVNLFDGYNVGTKDPKGGKVSISKVWIKYKGLYEQLYTFQE